MTKRSRSAVCVLLLSMLLSGLACSLGTPDHSMTPNTDLAVPDEKQTTNVPQLATPAPTYVQEESAAVENC